MYVNYCIVLLFSARWMKDRSTRNPVATQKHGRNIHDARSGRGGASYRQEKRLDKCIQDGTNVCNASRPGTYVEDHDPNFFANPFCNSHVIVHDVTVGTCSSSPLRTKTGRIRYRLAILTWIRVIITIHARPVHYVPKPDRSGTGSRSKRGSKFLTFHFQTSQRNGNSFADYLFLVPCRFHPCYHQKSHFETQTL